MARSGRLGACPRFHSLAEQGNHNPCVGGSNPSLATKPVPLAAETFLRGQCFFYCTAIRSQSHRPRPMSFTSCPSFLFFRVCELKTAPKLSKMGYSSTTRTGAPGGTRHLRPRTKVMTMENARGEISGSAARVIPVRLCRSRLRHLPDHELQAGGDQEVH